jgi:hypothetical protein
MKWRTSRPEYVHHPVQDERQERMVFAFLPKKCIDGYTRWLCNLVVEERYFEWPNTCGMAPYWQKERYRPARGLGVE